MSSELDIRIFECLENLEGYINDSPNTSFSGGAKRVVVFDEIMEIISEIKASVPEDVRKAHSVLADASCRIESADRNAKEIMEDAIAQANARLERVNQEVKEIQEKAALERDRILSEHEIVVAAKAKSAEMIEETEQYCISIVESVRAEANQILTEVQTMLDTTGKEMQKMVSSAYDRVEDEKDRVMGRELYTRHADEPDTTDYSDVDTETRPEPQKTEPIRTARPILEEDEEAVVPEYTETPRPKAPSKPGNILGKFARFFVEPEDETDGSDDEGEF